MQPIRLAFAPQLEKKLPAPILAAVLAYAMRLYAHGADIPIDPSALRMYCGIGLSQLSAVIALLALAGFWRAHTTLNPLAPDHASRLVTTGVFRLSRNPFYLSLLLLLVAYAIRIDSYLVWAGPGLFGAYVTRFQIAPEERALTDKFGSAYLDYKQRTRRWI